MDSRPDCPHPRIKCGTGSNLPPQTGEGTLGCLPAQERRERGPPCPFARGVAARQGAPVPTARGCPPYVTVIPASERESRGSGEMDSRPRIKSCPRLRSGSGTGCTGVTVDMSCRDGEYPPPFPAPRNRLECKSGSCTKEDGTIGTLTLTKYPCHLLLSHTRQLTLSSVHAYKPSSTAALPGALRKPAHCSTNVGFVSRICKKVVRI